MALCLLLLLEGSSKYTVQRAQMYPKRLFIAGGVGVNVAVAALLAGRYFLLRSNIGKSFFFYCVAFNIT